MTLPNGAIMCKKKQHIATICKFGEKFDDPVPWNWKEIIIANVKANGYTHTHTHTHAHTHTHTHTHAGIVENYKFWHLNMQ